MSFLEVFQKSIASKTYDHEGLYLLWALIENCPRSVLKLFTLENTLQVIKFEETITVFYSEMFDLTTKKEIFVMLKPKLTTLKTVKYIKGLTVFLCYYAARFGALDLISMLDSLQAK
jgi:hypothetical protein